MHATTAPKRRRLPYRLLWPWSAAAILATAGLPAASADFVTASATPTYRLLRLSADRYANGIDINASGQVVFTEQFAGVNRARFYDGNVLRTLGTLGGPKASTRALNDLGQVIGQSDLDRAGTLSHAYRWSRATGMVDIDAGTRTGSIVNDINENGQVAGSGPMNQAGAQQVIGYVWSPQSGKLRIGSFGNSSIAESLNNTGTVAGYAEGPGGGPYSILAFRWTRSEGIRDIGTLPGEFTGASDVNDAGQIVGATPFTPAGYSHAFVWTPRQGLRDLGVGTGERSNATKINQSGMVIGYVLRFGTLFHGFVWTREAGMLEFGAGSPAIMSDASDLNRFGQVVGSIGGRAMRWTRSTGMVDLNSRLVGAPRNLVLTNAYAISDNGAIVAGASSGLYLLVPRQR